MTIRFEKAVDEKTIFAVNAAAFETDAEARLVDMLRQDDDLTYSFVVEENEKLRGHIALSPIQASGGGDILKALGLGPVAVWPDIQQSGVGSALIKHAIEQARNDGWQVIFLMGNPVYYSRFGFSVAAAQPFASPYAGPYWQALWLDESVEKPQSGKAEYAPAFGRL